ncbi:MAG: hypothetical protein AB1Z98_12865 [Nannocystaceae bacterium]
MVEDPQGSSERHGDPQTPPVTICCSAADEAAVGSTAQALRARGYVVELAIGVERNVSVLIEAVEAMSGQGLYVLCRSHALDRTLIDQLRETLRNYDVPFGRTLTLAVDAHGPRDLEERIVSVLRRMVTGRPDGRPRAWGSSLPPVDEDPDTAVHQAVLPQDSPDAGFEEPTAVTIGHSDPFGATSQVDALREQTDGGRGHEPPTYSGHEPELPTYSGADHTAVGPAPTVGSSVPLPSHLPRPAAPLARSAVEPAAPTVEPAADRIPEPVATGPAVFPPAPPAPNPGFPPSTDSMGFEVMHGEASSAPMLAPNGVPAHQHPMTAGAASSSSAGDMDFEPPLTVGGRMGRALASPVGLAVVLGIAAVISLALVLPALLGDDDDGADEVAAAKPDADGAKTKADAKTDTKTGDAVEAKADDADEPDGADATAEAERADAEGEPAAADSPTPPEPTPEPVAGLPAAGVLAFVPGEPPPPVPERSEPAASDDPPEVAKALRDREVRAVDLFLVAPERSGTLSFDRAVSYCAELDVVGLTGWRVPSIGELNAVATANMLGRAVYWSATTGDTFGDVMLVLNTSKDRISVVTKGWDGAKIVCIRLRQP